MRPTPSQTVFNVSRPMGVTSSLLLSEYSISLLCCSPAVDAAGVSDGLATVVGFLISGRVFTGRSRRGWQAQRQAQGSEHSCERVRWLSQSPQVRGPDVD